MSKLKVLDLFSGIGGFSLGLERTEGFETVAFCEIDKHCQKVLKKHWPDVPTFDDVTKLKGKNFKNIDVICGGFPCQDISIAGKKEGLKGERSGLWSEFKRLIKEVKPQYAIIENVANLRNKGLNQVLKDLWSIGYDCEWHIISASSIGAPHLRERVWIVAHPNIKGLERPRRPKEIGKTRAQVQASPGTLSEGITPNTSSTRTGFNHSRVRRQFDRGSFQEGRNTNEEISKSPNADIFRLWCPFASEKEAFGWWTETTSKFHDVFRQILSVEPAICRSDDGFSSGLDRGRKQRIKQLGNAVVPQIPQLIGQAILEWERGIYE